MNTSRRTLLKASLAPLFFMAGTARAEEAALPDQPEIRIIQDKDPALLLARISTPGFDATLARAVLNFLFDTYPTANLPVWKLPLSRIDMHVRVTEIARHVVQAAISHAAIHPVDPCWIMGQIMAESFFYEFAVSSALAVGPCQFIAPTARTYGLVCADAHKLPPGVARKPELEPEFERAAQLRTRTRTLRRENSTLFSSPSKTLRAILNTLAAGKPVTNAKAYLTTLQSMEKLQSEYSQARDNARQYLQENFAGRSIFNPQDVVFLEKFDQRVLYEHSIGAMVRMMAENLRARNGNILAATAGYNAGPGNTSYPSGVYASFGRIPNFGETVDYVSKIVINHYEITRRL